MDLRGIGVSSLIHRLISDSCPGSLIVFADITAPCDSPRKTSSCLAVLNTLRVDLRGIAPRTRPCHGRVLLLYYKPDRSILIQIIQNRKSSVLDAQNFVWIKGIRHYTFCYVIAGAGYEETKSICITIAANSGVGSALFIEYNIHSFANF